MRHHHVRRVAAVDGDAERSRRIAHMLVAPRAQPALAAADPGIGRVLLALGGALGVGSGGFDGPGDLVPEREGQLPAAAHVELLAAAEVEVAVLQVEVGMAHAAMRDAQQHLGALRCRAWRPRWPAAAWRTRSEIGDASVRSSTLNHKLSRDYRLINNANADSARGTRESAARYACKEGSKYHGRKSNPQENRRKNPRRVPRYCRGEAARAVARSCWTVWRMWNSIASWATATARADRLSMSGVCTFKRAQPRGGTSRQRLRLSSRPCELQAL